MKQQMTCREEKISSLFLDIFGDDKKENGSNIYIYKSISKFKAFVSKAWIASSMRKRKISKPYTIIVLYTPNFHNLLNQETKKI